VVSAEYEESAELELLNSFGEDLLWKSVDEYFVEYNSVVFPKEIS
jgi:hypothetical protein